MIAKKLTLLAGLMCLSLLDYQAHSFSLLQAPNCRRVVNTPFHMAADETSTSTTTESSSSAKDDKPKKKKKTPPQEPAPLDVSKLDIRVGIIEKCWEHEEADKLYCEEIDLGEEGGPRRIASGLKAHYSVDEMVGKRVLVLANLKSRKLVGFPSHGMVLCASKHGEAEDGSEDSVEFVCPPEDAAIGERVVCAGFEGEPATENQVVKKKILNAVFPDLKVNTEGVAVYKDTPLTTSAGTCKTESLKDVPIY